MRRSVNVDQSAVWVQHAARGGGDTGAIHPVERLRERCHLNAGQISRQVLPAQVPPPRVAHLLLRSRPSGLLKHVGVRVDADGLGEVRRKKKGERPWPAADVK